MAYEKFYIQYALGLNALWSIQGLLGGFLVPNCTKKQQFVYKIAKNLEVFQPKNFEFKKISGMKWPNCG